MNKGNNKEDVLLITPEEFIGLKDIKKMSRKKRFLYANNINLKYAKYIKRNKDGTFSFTISDIPSIDALKELVDIALTY